MQQFGDSQQLRLVRILRSTVMVRVGGGWMALDEFLVKNDPCRGRRCVCCLMKVFFQRNLQYRQPPTGAGRAAALEGPRELRKISPGSITQYWAREKRSPRRSRPRAPRGPHPGRSLGRRSRSPLPLSRPLFPSSAADHGSPACRTKELPSFPAGSLLFGSPAAPSCCRTCFFSLF